MCATAVVVSTFCAVAAGQAGRGAAPTAVQSDDAVERARALFGEGLGFVEQQDWVQAEARFREVLAIRSSHVVSYNLASALVRLGRLNESAELLRVILRDASAETETREAAQQLLLEIEPRIGSITVRVKGEIDGAWLRLDDVPIELTAHVMTLSVDPGPHRLGVERNGELMGVRQLHVGGAAPARAEALFDLPAPAANAESRPPELRPRQPPAAARVAPSPIDRPEHSARDGGGILAEWWFWGGVAVVAAAATVTAVALSAPADPTAVRGDTGPPLLRVRVQDGAP